jgi:hypothetical protein
MRTVSIACDRCGTLIDTRIVLSMDLNAGVVRRLHDRLDLCERCAAEFRTWLGGEKATQGLRPMASE